MEKQIKFYQEKLEYEIDSWDLFESINSKQNIAVVDTRSEEAFNHEHIPEAINIPHRTMNQESTKQLDKNTLYITYCDGIGCNASTKGALKMAQLGFRVKELLGGLEWWKRDGYQTSGTNSSLGKAFRCGC